MRISVRQEADGCWYVVDEKGERYTQCGRWSTQELAQDEARKFLHSLGCNSSNYEIQGDMK